MGQIILSEAGAAIGSQFLPGGIDIFGQNISGEALGRAAGSIAGRSIDNALAAPRQIGPRLKSLHVMESREGASIPLIYGRFRVGGQVIWAANFKEHRQSSGGKTTPKTESFSYSVSFAVALCEGEISRVLNVWGNGEARDLANYTYRVYKGNDDQLPDPLIEAIEGRGLAPAYRGMAYVVFEDMPLAEFGNRLPQLSFEVAAPTNREGDPVLADHVTGVNIIPASGEFVYDTQIVRELYFPGTETTLNIHSAQGIADFTVSLDQLQEELPKAQKAALTVSWFGDDLRAGVCKLKPGIERAARVTAPYSWDVAGLGRGGAHLISTTDDNRPYYGGTPADVAVIRAIESMNDRGIAVTMSPFLMMDVPPENGLPDPYGEPEQAVFPWRGRITTTANGSAQARADVSAFVGVDGGFGYRHFILHHARLAARAGGVEAFLLGSEFRGMTRIQDQTGAFPFVEALIELAGEVRAILGPQVKISYAADWTEYGAYQAPDGATIYFPLDALWGDANIDFVGIDWYPPTGDWRDGDDHLDALAGYAAADDTAYLNSQFEGGEGYEWYYVSDADRDAQIRTPIVDSAHGEDWIFRSKDIRNWRNNTHYERIGGQRQATSTAWVAGSKPIRLSEIGYPALDKGGNSPNLFYDPKSAESAFPPYSNGQRDDIFQYRALSAALAFYNGLDFVEASYVWAWDGRPYPAFPRLTDIWTDSDNYDLGHWINGRTALSDLAAIVEDICERGGIDNVDAGALKGVVSGYASDGIASVRGLLEPLAAAYGFQCREDAGTLRFEHIATGALRVIDGAALAYTPESIDRALLDKAPGQMRLAYADPSKDYQPSVQTARRAGQDVRLSADVSLNVAMTEAEAARKAAYLLARANNADSVRFALPLAYRDISIGDVIGLNGRDWHITQYEEGAAISLSAEAITDDLSSQLYTAEAAVGAQAAYPSTPELVIIPALDIMGSYGEYRPLVGAATNPWQGDLQVVSGVDVTSQTTHATLTQTAIIGQIEGNGAALGPAGRWDYANSLQVWTPYLALSSITRLAALDGDNRAFIETDQGWELIGFKTADLISTERFLLTDLLRGLAGTPVGNIAQGARFVLWDEALERADVPMANIGLSRTWQVDGFEDTTQVFTPEYAPAWPVSHLKTQTNADGTRTLTWVLTDPRMGEGWHGADPSLSLQSVVEVDTGVGFVALVTTSATSATIPSGASGARVTILGAGGVTGASTTIVVP